MTAQGSVCWNKIIFAFCILVSSAIVSAKDQQRLASLFFNVTGISPSAALGTEGDPSMFAVLCAHPTQWPEPSQVCAVTGNHSGTPFYGSFVDSWLPELCRVDIKAKPCVFKAGFGEATDLDLTSGNVTYLSGPGIKQPCTMRLTNVNSTQVTLSPFATAQCPNGFGPAEGLLV
eukprot:gnl/MRDRNA2_/MRDRNA2_24050_c0_seq1.p1 gnl/MRDRNA2_/MRDRNA2_24050_c0~~gnl/MRDRNA2_/MRDRNA2_24050_c0_seq1.p1  ORF type:complete len:174 (-),score=26.47 gnl/MRDRNA2_/MRDRNA2_24050_c0_seq1:32-553(-)